MQPNTILRPPIPTSGERASPFDYSIFIVRGRMRRRFLEQRKSSQGDDEENCNSDERVASHDLFAHNLFPEYITLKVRPWSAVE